MKILGDVLFAAAFELHGIGHRRTMLACGNSVHRSLDRMHDFESRTGVQITYINDGQAVLISDKEIAVI